MDGRRVELHPERLVLHHRVRHRRDGRLQEVAKDGEGAPAVGPLQARAPDAGRRRRPQDHDGPLLAHVLDARRRRRRHHQRDRDHVSDRRQLGGRVGADRSEAEGARGRSDLAAARRERRLPADGLADDQGRRGDG